MAVRVTLYEEVPEGASARFSTVLRGLDGEVLGPSDIDSLTCTLYTEYQSGIINDRDGQDILNTNGGTLEADGSFSLLLDPADTVIVDSTSATELRVALITWVWQLSGISYTGVAELAVKIRNLRRERPLYRSYLNRSRSSSLGLCCCR